MPTTYRTPGVYVEEIATLPASVAQVPTAIPAFIGYTEKRPPATDSPAPIRSLVEFREQFGGPPPFVLAVDAKLELGADNRLVAPVVSSPQYHLYASVRLFFGNGGGTCYVISIGDYSTTPNKSHFISDGLSRLAKEQAPTLIVLPDAVALDQAGLIEVQQTALQQCAKVGNRFAIFDLQHQDKLNNAVKAFRNGIGVTNTKFGAAYAPWLVASPDLTIRFRDIKGHVTKLGSSVDFKKFLTPEKENEKVTNLENAISDVDRIEDSLEFSNARDEYARKRETFLNAPGKRNMGALVKHIRDLKQQTIDAWAEAEAESELKGEAKEANKVVLETLDKLLPDILEKAEEAGGTEDTSKIEPEVTRTFKLVLQGAEQVRLAARQHELLFDDALRQALPVYESLLDDLSAANSAIPPSGAIAGVYASVDANRGVWKAPANVNVTGAVALTHVIDDVEQEDYNIDTNSGLSINAIRAFPGKGILVWGARTLAGNDNEWRFVPVRRLFIMVEESIKRSTSFVVFEPNDANTWIKVKAMIENFLTGLWRQGALAGATPEQAFFVNVGLGTSMTPQDILEGRLIIEIGMAAVRPAEFIILRFSHKLQEA